MKEVMKRLDSKGRRSTIHVNVVRKAVPTVRKIALGEQDDPRHHQHHNHLTCPLLRSRRTAYIVGQCRELTCQCAGVEFAGSFDPPPQNAAFGETHYGRRTGLWVCCTAQPR